MRVRSSLKLLQTVKKTMQIHSGSTDLWTFSPQSCAVCYETEHLDAFPIKTLSSVFSLRYLVFEDILLSSKLCFVSR